LNHCYPITYYALTCISVDWQHPCDAQQGSDFLSLLATVRLYLPTEEYMVVVPLPTNQWALQHIDLPRIQKYVDLVNLMAYDFSGPWRHTAGHHAQFYPVQEGENSGSAVVEYILSAGFPRKKILLGVPLYERSFIGAASSCDQYNLNGGNDGIFEYNALPRTGTQGVVDTARCAAMCVGGEGWFVTYDNPETVVMKGRYCREKDLGVSFGPF
jgi:chitinase